VQKEFRSLDGALTDLLAAQQFAPDPARVRIIEMVRAEIEHRKTAQASPSGPGGSGWRAADDKIHLAAVAG
jgi:hypothetical protein